MRIRDKEVGPGRPTYVIAELSANHRGSIDVAVEIVRAAAAAGANAIKTQTYTADTMTIESDQEPFLITGGTPWDGRTLYELYSEAQMPWEWHEPLRDEAHRFGMAYISTAFDVSSVTHLTDIGIDAYKIASFELVDTNLIASVAATGRPVIISTGMSSLHEIDDAIKVAAKERTALLHCTSSYPAPIKDANLTSIPDMKERYGLPIGLSDHTLGTVVAIAAAAAGADLIEKHLIDDRGAGGPDAAFSLEPSEFAAMVGGIRQVDSAMGRPRTGPTDSEKPALRFRRSLFVTKDMAEGDEFDESNVRSIRPSEGLPPKQLKNVLGRRATRAIEAGSPLTEELIG